MIARHRNNRVTDQLGNRCIFPGTLDVETIRRIPDLMHILPPNSESIDSIIRTCEEVGVLIQGMINSEGPQTVRYAMHSCPVPEFHDLEDRHPVKKIIGTWLRFAVWEELARAQNKVSQTVLDQHISANDLNMYEVEYPARQVDLKDKILTRAAGIREELLTDGPALVRQLIGNLDGSASSEELIQIARAVQFWIYYSVRKKLARSSSIPKRK